MFMNGFLMYHKQGYEALSSFEDYQTDLSNQVKKIFNNSIDLLDIGFLQCPIVAYWGYYSIILFNNIKKDILF